MINKIQFLVAVVFCVSVLVPVVACPDVNEKPHKGPIAEFKKMSVVEAELEDAHWHEPITITSKEDAKKYFAADSFDRIAKTIKFDERKLVIVAWKGSGDDKLGYEVLESYPEQIAYKVVGGKSRDLKFHARVFSLRKNVRHYSRK